MRVLLLILLLLPSLVFAQDGDIPAAITKTRADIETSVTELDALRLTIGRQRRPLADRLEALQKDVGGLRTEARRLRGLRNQSESANQQVEQDLAAHAEDLNFIASALTEYRRAVEAQAGVAEVHGLKGTFRNIDQELDRDDHVGLSKAADELLQLASILRSGMEGGARFPGACLDGKGVEQKGTFVMIGPFSYFASKGETVGMVSTRAGSALPSIHPATPPEAGPAIRQLAEGAEVAVPIDLTLGDALKVVASKRSLMDRIIAGGYTMIPLLLVAGLAALLAVWKALSLAGVRTHAPRVIDEIVADLKAGEVSLAESAADRTRRPLAPILRAGIAYHQAPREHLEEIMHERMLAAIPSLDRHLGTLAVLGGIAPLLGLLGTVTGMIHTFQLVTLFGTGNANMLSGGISEALTTTMFGLMIAIPVLLVHAFLARRVKTIIAHLEQTIVRFVNQLTVSGADS